MSDPNEAEIARRVAAAESGAGYSQDRGTILKVKLSEKTAKSFQKGMEALEKAGKTGAFIGLMGFFNKIIQASPYVQIMSDFFSLIVGLFSKEVDWEALMIILNKIVKAVAKLTKAFGDLMDTFGDENEPGTTAWWIANLIAGMAGFTVAGNAAIDTREQETYQLWETQKAMKALNPELVNSKINVGGLTTKLNIFETDLADFKFPSVPGGSSGGGGGDEGDWEWLEWLERLARMGGGT